VSIYWEIPQLELGDVIEDFENGEIEGLKMEHANIEGELDEDGRPRITDGENYAWLYEGETGMGMKVFCLTKNDPEPIKRRLRQKYPHISFISEQEMGIIHVG